MSSYLLELAYLLPLEIISSEMCRWGKSRSDIPLHAEILI